MAGLVPAIHADLKQDVDARDKPGHDEANGLAAMVFTLPSDRAGDNSAMPDSRLPRPHPRL